MGKAATYHRIKRQKRETTQQTAAKVADGQGLFSTDAEFFIQQGYQHAMHGNSAASQIHLMAAMWREIVARLGGQENSEVIRNVVADCTAYANLVETTTPKPQGPEATADMPSTPDPASQLYLPAKPTLLVPGQPAAPGIVIAKR